MTGATLVIGLVLAACIGTVVETQRKKWIQSGSKDAACVEELVQVKRGVTGMSESTLEFRCSHPRHQLIQPISPYQGVPTDGVYVCRCVDLHAVTTKQSTQLSILFQRLDWMEKNGWAPPASSTQMQSVLQRLDWIEQREQKP